MWINWDKHNSCVALLSDLALELSFNNNLLGEKNFIFISNYHDTNAYLLKKLYMLMFGHKIVYVLLINVAFYFWISHSFAPFCFLIGVSRPGTIACNARSDSWCRTVYWSWSLHSMHFPLTKVLLHYWHGRPPSFPQIENIPKHNSINLKLCNHDMNRPEFTYYISWWSLM